MYTGDLFNNKWISHDELYQERRRCINQVHRFYLAMHCLMFFIAVCNVGKYPALAHGLTYCLACLIVTIANKLAMKLTYQQAIHNLTKED